MNLKSLLSSSFIFASFAASAQDGNSTFAVTGDGNGDFMWMNIRQIDVTTGKLVKDIYLRDKTAFVMLDADTRKPVESTVMVPTNASRTANVTFGNVPTASMVAAAAYDKTHDKLFFTPMRIGELRWLDLSAKGDQPKFYSLRTTMLNTGDLITDESNHITRMVINADGNGYTITNDGNHLIRFTTGKKVTISDLGALVDDETNKGISIHNKCTSWGGDMVADAYNNLYVVTGNHNVFKVNVETKIATYLGAITGLPAAYSTNGAAVDKEGNIMVSSANMFDGFYKFNLKDLVASRIEGSDKIYNASDLANGNLLYQKEADAAQKFGTPELREITPQLTSDYHVYPNPVTNNEFKILFDNQKPGAYNVAITDLSGKVLMNKTVNVSMKGQIESVKINSMLGKGMYMVKVTDSNNQFIFTERIIVQ